MQIRNINYNINSYNNYYRNNNQRGSVQSPIPQDQFVANNASVSFGSAETVVGKVEKYCTPVSVSDKIKIVRSYGNNFIEIRVMKNKNSVVPFRFFLKPNGKIDYSRTDKLVQLTTEKSAEKTVIHAKDMKTDVYSSLTRNDDQSEVFMIYNNKNYKVAEGELYIEKTLNSQTHKEEIKTEFICKPFADSDSPEFSNMFVIKDGDIYFIYSDEKSLLKRSPEFEYNAQYDAFIKNVDIVNGQVVGIDGKPISGNTENLQKLLRKLSLAICDTIKSKYAELYKKTLENYVGVSGAIKDTDKVYNKFVKTNKNCHISNLIE